jgi:hypothetical protein
MPLDRNLELGRTTCVSGSNVSSRGIQRSGMLAFSKQNIQYGPWSSLSVIIRQLPTLGHPLSTT